MLNHCCLLEFWELQGSEVTEVSCFLGVGTVLSADTLGWGSWVRTDWYLVHCKLCLLEEGERHSLAALHGGLILDR